MDIIIKKIEPRLDSDSKVSNVTVQFFVPEKEHRFNEVTVTVFVDKSIDSLTEIYDLARNESLHILRTIIDRHPLLNHQRP